MPLERDDGATRAARQPCGAPGIQHVRMHRLRDDHPIIEGYDPPEGWGWCYVDEIGFDLTERATPQRGPIPRYY